MEHALGNASWAIFRRNVGAGYTNIAIMGSVVAIAAGELLKEPRLFDYGASMLKKVLEDADLHGHFDEYNSPCYTIIAIHECERGLEMIHNPKMRKLLKKVKRLAWEMIASHYHPGTNQWSGPHSRAATDASGLLANQANTGSHSSFSCVIPICIQRYNKYIVLFINLWRIQCTTLQTSKFESYTQL